MERLSDRPLENESKFLRIRAMSAHDLPRVDAIEQVSFSNPWAIGIFARELTAKNSRCCSVVDAAGHIVAYSVAWEVEDECHLLVLAVRGDRRREGIGRFLLRHVEREALADGSEMVFLEVRPSNAGARAFYESLGYQQMDRRKDYYPNGEDAIIMAKHIRLPGD